MPSPDLVPNSPAWLAAITAGAPNKGNPQGSPLYQQAYSGAFAGPKVGDIWSQQDASMAALDQGANFTPIGAVNVGPNTWQSKGTTTTIQLPGGGTTYNFGGGAGMGTNLGSYGPDVPTTPTPSPLNYLGLPNYANMGSNFTGGTNSSNPFAGLFGGPDQTNFLSGWT